MVMLAEPSGGDAGPNLRVVMLRRPLRTARYEPSGGRAGGRAVVRRRSLSVPWVVMLAEPSGGDAASPATNLRVVVRRGGDAASPATNLRVVVRRLWPPAMNPGVVIGCRRQRAFGWSHWLVMWRRPRRTFGRQRPVL